MKERSGECEHRVWVQDGQVFIANEEDDYYHQRFEDLEELRAFVFELESAAAEAFGQAP